MKTLDRTQVIRQSVSVLIRGIAGLVPFVGILPAASAIILGLRIRRAYPGINPVDHYRKWGMALGILFLLLNIYAVGIFVVNLLNQANRGYYMNYGGQD